MNFIVKWIIFWIDICHFWWKVSFLSILDTFLGNFWAIFGHFSYSISMNDSLTIELNYLLNWIRNFFLNWILAKAILNRILNQPFLEVGILRFTSTNIHLKSTEHLHQWIIEFNRLKIFNPHAVPGKHVSGSNFRNFILSLSPSSYIYLGRVC